MRKEVIIAVMFGAIFGLVLAYGFFRVNKVFNKQPQNVTQKNTLQPTPTTENHSDGSFTITLTKPEDDEVAIDNPVTITGITKPNSIIAISSDVKDYITKSDQNGAFSQEVDLSAGLNQILIKAFDDQGKSSAKNLNLVYSSEYLKQLNLAQ